MASNNTELLENQLYIVKMKWGGNLRFNKLHKSNVRCGFMLSFRQEYDPINHIHVWQEEDKTWSFNIKVNNIPGNDRYGLTNIDSNITPDDFLKLVTNLYDETQGYYELYEQNKRKRPRENIDNREEEKNNRESVFNRLGPINEADHVEYSEANPVKRSVYIANAKRRRRKMNNRKKRSHGSHRGGGDIEDFEINKVIINMAPIFKTTSTLKDIFILLQNNGYYDESTSTLWETFVHKAESNTINTTSKNHIIGGGSSKRKKSKQSKKNTNYRKRNNKKIQKKHIKGKQSRKHH